MVPVSSIGAPFVGTASRPWPLVPESKASALSGGCQEGQAPKASANTSSVAETHFRSASLPDKGRLQHPQC